LVNIPANLRPKTAGGSSPKSRPLTVGQQKKIKQYGSLENYKQYVSATQTQAEVEAEIKRLGLDNITSEADYAAKYSQASATAKKYLETPAAMKVRIETEKKTIIDTNNKKLDEAIAKAESDKKEKYNSYMERYYSAKKRGSSSAQRYKDKAKEYEAYYDGMIDGYKAGYNKLADYSDINSYARDVARYEQRKEKAYLADKNFKDKRPGESTQEWNDRLVNKMRQEGAAYLQKNPDAFGGGIDYKTGIKYKDDKRVSVIAPTEIVIDPVTKTKMQYSAYQKLDSARAKQPTVTMTDIPKRYITPTQKQSVYKENPLFTMTTKDEFGQSIASGKGTEIIEYKEKEKTIPDYLNPSKRKSELEVVKDLFNVPDLKKIERRVPMKNVNELVEKGKTILSNGVIAVTPSYANKYNIDIEREGVWVVDSATKESARDELTYARDYVQLATNPMPWKSRGVMEQDASQIDYAKRGYGLLGSARSEIETEIDKFKADPENYPGSIGTSTKEGVSFELSEDYIKGLPAQQALGTFVMNQESAYLESQKYDRKKTMTPSNNTFGTAFTEANKNAALEIGSIANTWIKTAAGVPLFYGNMLTAGSTQLSDSSGEFTSPKVTYGKGTFMDNVMNIPTTQSLSGFKYGQPGTWGNVGAYAKEIVERPETVAQIGITTGMIYATAAAGLA